MKNAGNYVLDIPILMKETIPFKTKQNLTKLKTLSQLHMSDQKVSRVEKSWRTLKKEVNEKECVLLRYKQKAPRYEKVPEWYTEYWEEQKQVR